jgi:hypothetical protein
MLYRGDSHGRCIVYVYPTVVAPTCAIQLQYPTVVIPTAAYVIRRAASQLARLMDLDMYVLPVQCWMKTCRSKSMSLQRQYPMHGFG